MIARVLQPCRHAEHEFTPGEVLTNHDPRITTRWIREAERDGLIEVIGEATRFAPFRKGAA